MRDSATLAAPVEGRPTLEEITEGTVTLPGEFVLETIATLYAIGAMFQQFSTYEKALEIGVKADAAGEALRVEAWGATIDTLDDEQLAHDPVFVFAEARSDEIAAELCEELGLPVAALCYRADAEAILEGGRTLNSSTFATYQREASLALVPRERMERIEDAVERLENALATLPTVEIA